MRFGVRGSGSGEFGIQGVEVGFLTNGMADDEQVLLPDVETFRARCKCNGCLGIEEQTVPLHSSCQTLRVRGLKLRVCGACI